jgi:hypothetical protein
MNTLIELRQIEPRLWVDPARVAYYVDRLRGGKTVPPIMVRDVFAAAGEAVQVPTRGRRAPHRSLQAAS